MKIIITDTALDSLDNILDFLEYTNGQSKALLIGEILTAEALNLTDFPYKGQIEPLLEDQSKEYRRIVVEGRYKIVYSIEDDTIYVFRFFDTRQDPAKMKG